MNMNSIAALWGYTCYINEDGVLLLIDSEENHRELTEAELTEVNAWITEEESKVAKITLPESITNVIYLTEDPTIETNPIDVKMSAININSGETFNCKDNTIDKNIWVGQLGTSISPIPEANTFDFYDDSSTVAFYKFRNNAKDEGGIYHGEAKNIDYDETDGEYSISSSRKSTIAIKGLPFDSNTPAVTICCWIRWSGKTSTMAFGFSNNTLYSNKFYGINTGNGDTKGIEKNDAVNIFKKRWVYQIVTFKSGAYGNINVNGEDLNMYITDDEINENTTFTDELNLFGWPSSSSYRDFGDLARVRVINRELSLLEKQRLYIAETKAYGGLL